MLSESQFWIKWLVWAGAPSCWKTYGLPNTVSMASLHPSECAAIALSYTKSALELFQRGSPRGAFFRVTSSLTYWNLHWTVLKPYYVLPQHHKRLILGIISKKLFPLLSTQREGLRCSRLFHLISTSRPFWEYLLKTVY